MNKEYLEALGTFEYIMTRCKDEDSYIIKFPLGIQKGTTFGEDMEKAHKVIKDALQRLEAIDNAKPSEALGNLTILSAELGTSKDSKFTETKFPKMLIAIKQYILKAQEQEKVLEIIKEKDFNFDRFRYALKYWDTIEEQLDVYNSGIGNYYKLTEEEFDLLKRLVKNG